VICISHATAAGGEDVGRIVAARLGFRYADEEIVTAAARRENLDRRDLEDVERRKSFITRVLDELGKGGLAGAYPGMVAGPAPPLVDEELLRGLIQQSVHETATAGSIVIVAHAASIALAGEPDVLRVLVTASPEVRASRLGAAQGLDDKAAAKAITDSDAGRASYMKKFYGIGRELPTHYDLVLSTDVLSTQQVADVVVHAATA
jgi:cytidylate kinase